MDPSRNESKQVFFFVLLSKSKQRKMKVNEKPKSEFHWFSFEKFNVKQKVERLCCSTMFNGISVLVERLVLCSYKINFTESLISSAMQMCLFYPFYVNFMRSISGYRLSAFVSCKGSMISLYEIVYHTMYPLRLEFQSELNSICRF